MLITFGLCGFLTLVALACWRSGCSSFAAVLPLFIITYPIKKAFDIHGWHEFAFIFISIIIYMTVIFFATLKYHNK